MALTHGVGQWILHKLVPSCSNERTWSQPAVPLKGPAELVLAASIARRHYVDGRTKIEIADEFRLSRFKVARLLEAARAQGLVRIEIGHAGTIDVDTSGRLAERFGCGTPSSSTPGTMTYLAASQPG